MEMTGNQNKIAWHHTRQHNHLLDRITNYVLRDIDHDERDFAAAPANDERVINGPGVNVPCISLNRWPYEEYHTTDDNLDIMHEDMLVGAADVAEKIIRIYASNYIPKRTFHGPVFLSGNGLWVDWHDNWELNRAIEKIMMRFEGQHSVFDIAEQVGLDYEVVRDYVEQFRAKGFIIRCRSHPRRKLHEAKSCCHHSRADDFLAFARKDSCGHCRTAHVATRLHPDLAGGYR